MKRIFSALAVLCASTLAGGALKCAAAKTAHPNFIVIVADDLGYGDLRCYGAGDIHSPHLDRFAAEGVRFTSCYAGHANCSPSRTALMTGRTPTRVGVRSAIPEDSPMHLRRSEITIATLLRDSGYATCHSGKWHLNGAFNQPTQPQPGDHGFEHWFSTQNNAYPNHRDPDNFVRNGREVGVTRGFAADLVVEEATRWLRDGRDKAKPFFLYVCFHEPHEPIATADEFKKLYPSDDPSFSAHHGNISQMDAAFGRLMRVLDEDKLRDTTFVMFTSDNGPAITRYHPHGSAGPLRDKKGSLYEGGIRVPGLVRWPGRAKPGTVSDEPICGVDFLPTVCALTGLTPPQDRALDGASFLAALDGQAIPRRTPLYWHFNRASGAPKVAMRIGDWKILATLDNTPQVRGNDLTEATEREIKTAEPATFFLYNLRTDIAETTDLSTKEPARLEELKSALLPKYYEVRDESPTWPPWKFTGAESRRIVWPADARKR